MQSQQMLEAETEALKGDGWSNSYARVGYRRTVYAFRAFLYLPAGM